MFLHVLLAFHRLVRRHKNTRVTYIIYFRGQYSDLNILPHSLYQ